MGPSSRIKTAGMITFVVLVWALCWPVFKIALAYTPPILFAGMRTLLGGIFLVILLLPKHRLIRWQETWPIYFISSLFNCIMFYGIQTVGLMYLPAGLFSVIVYLQPVLVGIFAWIWLGEPISALKIVGLILGFLGVLTVSADGFTGHLSLIGIGMALMSGTAWAVGTVYVKKVSTKVDSRWLVALQCIIAGIVLIGLGLGMENPSKIVWNLPYLCGLFYGGIFGIAAAWVVYFNLVGSGEASKVASFTFLVPLISVMFGTFFLKEPFTFSLFAGLILIIISIYLVNRKPKVLVNHSKSTNSLSQSRL